MNLEFNLIKQGKLSQAFRAIFAPKGKLSHEAEIVMKELHTFAFMNKPSFFTDISPEEIIGRQKMYSFITELMNYDSYELDKTLRLIREKKEEAENDE